MAAGISVRGVSKVFRRPGSGVHALAGVHLDIRAGELVLLTGPSGCGKTTLLHMIAGHESPDGGLITVGERPVCGPGPDRALVFQESGLFPWMTCRQNVEYGLRMLHVKGRERQRRARAALARVGLEGLADRHPHEISGGQRQRVAIARALVVQPEVLLCDEPFASLDASTRRRLAADVVRLWQAQRMTVVWVEHDLHLAPVLADRVILFASSPGRVVGELLVDLPRPRSPSDPRVTALAGWLHDWLESPGNERRAPPPEGARVSGRNRRWPARRWPAPGPGSSAR